MTSSISAVTSKRAAIFHRMQEFTYNVNISVKFRTRSSSWCTNLFIFWRMWPQVLFL